MSVHYPENRLPRGKKGVELRRKNNAVDFHTQLHDVTAKVRGEFADTLVELQEAAQEAGRNSQELLRERIAEINRSFKGQEHPAAALVNGWMADLNREVKHLRELAEGKDRAEESWEEEGEVAKRLHEEQWRTGLKMYENLKHRKGNKGGHPQTGVSLYRLPPK